MSLAAELTFDRIERTRVFGARQIARVATMLTAYSGGVYVVNQFEPAAAGTMAAICGVFSIVSVAWGVSRLPPERADFPGSWRRQPRACRRRRLDESARAAPAVRLLHRVDRVGRHRRSGPVRRRVRDAAEGRHLDARHADGIRRLHARVDSALARTRAALREAEAVAVRDGAGRRRLRTGVLHRRRRLAADGARRAA